MIDNIKKEWMTKQYEPLLNYKIVHFEILEDVEEGILYPSFTLLEAKTGEIKKIKVCNKYGQDEGLLMIADYGKEFTI